MFTYVLCGEGESFPESFGDIFARVEFGNTWAKHRNASRLFSLDDFVFENQFRAQRGWILFLSRPASCYERLEGHIFCALQMLLMNSLQNSVAFAKSNSPCVSSNKVAVLSPN